MTFSQPERAKAIQPYNVSLEDSQILICKHLTPNLFTKIEALDSAKQHRFHGTDPANGK